MSRCCVGFALTCAASVVLGCSGLEPAFDGTGPGPGPDAGADVNFDDLDVERARERFVTTTDVMRLVIAPGCAAETNECHSNEDFPDLHTDGNLWNLVGLPCNLGVGDRTTIEGMCEQLGDRIRIEDGPNAGYEATIGSIDTVTNEDGEFDHYQIVVDAAPAANQVGARFSVVRNGAVIASLGGGGSLDVVAAASALRVTRAADLPDPAGIRQGDENGDGVYGDGQGMLVRPGEASNSYLYMRLSGANTARERMPLSGNADNPTEQNSRLSPDEMYAIRSWINCMQAGDGPYSPIRYGCDGEDTP